MSKNFLFEFDKNISKEQPDKASIFAQEKKQEKSKFESNLENFYESFRYQKYKAYNAPPCDYLSLDSGVNEYSTHYGFHPTIYDSSIFNINYKDIEKRIRVKEIHSNYVYITIDDFYVNPLAVRKFAEKTPVALAKQISPTSYPGYTNTLMSDTFVLGEMQFLFEQVFKKYFLERFSLPLELEEFFQRENGFFEFQSTFGIFSPSHITYENSVETIHTDSILNSNFSKMPLASVLYLNLPSECEGGTALFVKKSDQTDQQQYEILDTIEMKFNRVAIYPTFIYHKHIYDKQFWQQKWRIIQRIFFTLGLRKDNELYKIYKDYIKDEAPCLDEELV